MSEEWSPRWNDWRECFQEYQDDYRRKHGHLNRAARLNTFLKKYQNDFNKVEHNNAAYQILLYEIQDMVIRRTMVAGRKTPKKLIGLTREQIVERLIEDLQAFAQEDVE